jgi:hypothetical protein
MRRLLPLLSLLLLDAALADPMQEALRQLQQLGMDRGEAAEAYQQIEALNVVALTERDVTSFIAVAGELDKLALPPLGDEAGAAETAAALRASSAAMRIIESRGFSVERLQDVSYSIALAMMSLQLEEEGQDPAALRAQQEAALAELRGSVPPEMLAMFQQELAMASGIMADLGDQPPQNKDLARRYRAELEPLFDDGDE